VPATSIAKTTFLEAGNSRRPGITDRVHLRNEHTASDLARRGPASDYRRHRRVVIRSIERILQKANVRSLKCSKGLIVRLVNYNSVYIRLATSKQQDEQLKVDVQVSNHYLSTQR